MIGEGVGEGQACRGLLGSCSCSSARASTACALAAAASCYVCMCMCMRMPCTYLDGLRLGCGGLSLLDLGLSLEALRLPPDGLPFPLDRRPLRVDHLELLEHRVLEFRRPSHLLAQLADVGVHLTRLRRQRLILRQLGSVEVGLLSELGLALL